jgi:hypothetical protein
MRSAAIISKKFSSVPSMPATITFDIPRTIAFLIFLTGLFAAKLSKMSFPSRKASESLVTHSIQITRASGPLMMTLIFEIFIFEFLHVQNAE